MMAFVDAQELVNILFTDPDPKADRNVTRLRTVGWLWAALSKLVKRVVSREEKDDAACFFQKRKRQISSGTHMLQHTFHFPYLCPPFSLPLPSIFPSLALHFSSLVAALLAAAAD